MTEHVSYNSKQAGFTLVELLIVAIILAILAAIVVPQFASSTDDARDSALKSNLAGIRSAVDLYAQQHGNTFPGAATAVPVGCTAGTDGAGAANSPEALRDQLRYFTNAAGQACSVSDNDANGTPEFPFGPYLKAEIPENPVTSDDTVTVISAGNLAMLGAGAGGGWRYDTTTGKFIADDTDTDGNGVRYDAY